MKTHHLTQHHPSPSMYRLNIALADLLGFSLGAMSIDIKNLTGIGFATIEPSSVLLWLFDKSQSYLSPGILSVAMGSFLLSVFNAAFMGAAGYFGTKAAGALLLWGKKKYKSIQEKKNGGEIRRFIRRRKQHSL